MRLPSIVLASLISLCSTATLAEQLTMLPANHRLGVQAAIATGGNLGIGLVDFTEKTELGFTISGSIDNASHQTKFITPVIFGGLRKSLCECTYFAYGIDALAIYGKDQGHTIRSFYQIGPYISLEQMLTTHLMLTGWILPYQYQHDKTGGESISTHSFFASGGIGFNYFF